MKSRACAKKACSAERGKCGHASLRDRQARRSGRPRTSRKRPRVTSSPSSHHRVAHHERLDLARDRERRPARSPMAVQLRTEAEPISGNSGASCVRLRHHWAAEAPESTPLPDHQHGGCERASSRRRAGSADRMAARAPTGAWERPAARARRTSARFGQRRHRITFRQRARAVLPPVFRVRLRTPGLTFRTAGFKPCGIHTAAVCGGVRSASE